MSSSLAPAALTAAVALFVAVIAQIVNIALSRGDRRYDRRRDALIAVREAVLTLREETTRYGFAVRKAVRDAVLVNGQLDISVPDKVLAAWAAAAGRLKMVESLVDDKAVRDSVRDWRALSEANRVSPSDVDAADEEKAFERVIDTLGQAARSQAARGDRWRRTRKLRDRLLRR